MALPTEFSAWTEKDAKQAIEAAIAEAVTPAGFKANKAFVESHDHWQNGETWVGPNGGTDTTVRAAVLLAVKRQFTPVDVISEVLDRCVNALVKREPQVELIPLADEEPPAEGSAEADGAEDERRAILTALAAWWDRVKLWEVAKQAVRRSRWAGRGALRLWIPAGKLAAGEGAAARLPSGLALTEALGLLELEAPPPDAAYVYTDLNSQRRVAIVTTTDADDKALIELWYLDGDDLVCRVIGSEAEPFRVAGVGRLPVAEMAARVLITEPVRRQQNRLNFFESVLVRVGETGGFPERYTLNAAASGLWSSTTPEDDPAAPTIERDGTTYYLHAMPRTLGASITTDLVGITTEDADGKKTLATPGVEKFDPTDPSFAIKSAEHARRVVLASCKQKHVALQETGEASGTAYAQARADFEDDLHGVRPALEGMLRDILEAALAFARAMGAEDVLADYRVGVTLHVQTGPVTPEEASSNAGLVTSGLLSIETAMHRNGIEDPEAERERILTSPIAKAELVRKQAEAIKALTDAGADLATAAALVGMDEEAVKKLGAPRALEPVEQ